MAERGGPTTQSGVLYQNTIAALYLARLVDSRLRTAADKVVRAHVESLDHVDDLVVVYADGHKDFIQVKESVDVGGAWNSLWRDFGNQFGDSVFTGSDRLVLVTSQSTELIGNLQEICKRTQNAKDQNVWLSRVPESLRGTLKHVKNSFDPALNDEQSFALLRRVSVECWGSLEQLERDALPYWVPESNVEQSVLFGILRDMIGGQARLRGEFTVSFLLEQLNEKGIQVKDQHDAVGLYQRAFQAVCSTFELSGTNLRGAIDQAFVWPKVVEDQPLPSFVGFLNTDDEDSVPLETQEVDMRRFPGDSYHRAILVAGAGFGKSTLLRAIAHQLLHSPIWVPAIISLPELVDSGEGLIDFLSRKTRMDYDCEVDWSHYLATGRAVLLLDGLDEVHQNRVTVLQHLSALGSRYPLMPWIMAVRDAAAVSAPLNVPYLRICPFDDDGVKAFVKAYHSLGVNLSPETVTKRRWQDHEFSRLSSIPFFLALVLATNSSAQDLARGRTTLLNSYLALSLMPSIYRPDSQVVNDSGLLMQAAQLLAEEALLSSGSGLPEHRALALLRASIQDARADSLLNDLVICGVVRRNPGWISFVFPIVQEYLVSRRLSDLGEAAVLERFDLLKHRPWAQVVQFAIEQLTNASGVLQRLLDTQDDAYLTILRVVGRCVVHGAQVSRELKKTIGEKLAEAWLDMPTYRLNQEVGALIADGFLTPPPDEVIRLLRVAKGLQSGGDRILTLLGDAELTKTTLTEFIKGPRPYYLHGWQAAVDQIADYAFDTYMQRVRETNNDEFESLSSLLLNLDSGNLSPDRISTWLSEPELPELIRVSLLAMDPSSDISALTDAAVSLISRCANKDGPYMLFQLLVRRGVHKQLITSVVNRVPDTDLLEWLLASVCGHEDLSVDDKGTIISDVAKILHDRPKQLMICQIFQLSLGEISSFEHLITQTDLISDLHLGAITIHVTMISSADMVPNLIRASSGLDISKRRSVAEALSFGLRYEAEVVGSGWAGRRQRLHPCAREAAETLFRWAGEASGVDRLLLLANSAELGHQVAPEHLFSLLLTTYMALRSEGHHNRLSMVLRVLERRKLLLPIEVLVDLVSQFDSNDCRAAVRMLARHGTELALDRLIELRRRPDQPGYIVEGIESELERLSGQLGVVLDRDEGGLLVRRN